MAVLESVNPWQENQACYSRVCIDSFSRASSESVTDHQTGTRWLTTTPGGKKKWIWHVNLASFNIVRPISWGRDYTARLAVGSSGVSCIHSTTNTGWSGDWDHDNKYLPILKFRRQLKLKYLRLDICWPLVWGWNECNWCQSFFYFYF